MDEDHKVVCIVGMHRSGTSAVTRCIKEMGVDLGDDFPAARDDNPTGFWEDSHIVAINEAILDKLGLTWFSLEPPEDGWWERADLNTLRTEAVMYIRATFGNAPVWGFKDPRTSLLLPFWQDLFDKMKFAQNYIVAVRNPLSVARSLSARDGLRTEHALLLWLRYTIESMFRTKGKKRVIVDYDTFLDDPKLVMKHIALGLSLPTPDPTSIQWIKSEFLDKTLRHHSLSKVDVTAAHLPAPIEWLYDQCLQEAAGTGAPSFDQELESTVQSMQYAILAYRLADKERSAARRWYEEVESTRGKIDQNQATIRGLKENVQEVLLRATHWHEEADSLREKAEEEHRVSSELRDSVRMANKQISAIDTVLTSTFEELGPIEVEDSEDNQVSNSIEKKISNLTNLLRKEKRVKGARNNVAVQHAEQLADTVEAFRESTTWKVAKGLQIVLGHTNYDPIASLRKDTEEMITRLRSNGKDALDILRNIQSHVRALLDSRTLRVAASLARLRSYLRGTLPQVSVMNGLIEFSSKLEGTLLVESTVNLFSRNVPEENRYKAEYLSMQKRASGMGREHYVPLREHPKFTPREEDVKVIAFYLPQFHRTSENDRFWERGFTEWTNVTKAVPQFVGHVQPQLPIDLGFYDLKNVDTLKRQAELAANYGIYGFCFHHYWFSGKTPLRTPLELLVHHPEIQLRFCLNWANENWTRTWDGLDSEILLSQNYSEVDGQEFIKDAMRYFSDPRYIRISEKPVLVVYRPTLIPNIRDVVAGWRKYCEDAGIGKIFLVSTHAFDSHDPREIGFDATLEFAPNNFDLEDVSAGVDILNPDFKGRILSYADALRVSREFQRPKYKMFRGLCTGWDNEARRPGRGTVLYGASPDKYEMWLDDVVTYTRRTFGGSERLIFVNAWNEWAEGAHLEPDREFGYSYLSKTREVVDGSRITGEQVYGEQQAEIAVVIHLFHTELWGEIRRMLLRIPCAFDLFVTIPGGCKDPTTTIRIIKEEYPLARVVRVRNRGRDVMPFLEVLAWLNTCHYTCVLKIHSKRSLHRSDGDIWRNEMFEQLVGDEDRVARIIDRFKTDAQVGISGPKKFLVPICKHIGGNREGMRRIGSRLGIRDPLDGYFIGGTMFWFRPKALAPLLELGLQEDDFPPERGEVDGELQHVLERLMVRAAEQAGFTVVPTEEC